MTPELLTLANVCLLARLFCLFRDDAVGGRVWRIKALVEIGAATLLFPLGAGWAALVATLGLFNYLGWRLELRSRRRELLRLWLGLVELVVLSVWLSPRLGPGFRPELAAVLAAFSRWTAAPALPGLLGSGRFQAVCFGLLLAANESNLAIRAIFNWPGLGLRAAAATTGSSVIDAGELNRGRIIGILERVLVYGFVLQAQYGAIGFILAAKAFARFKALDDRNFAEYVLIGTLLSAALAIACGLLVRLGLL